MARKDPARKQDQRTIKEIADEEPLDDVIGNYLLKPLEANPAAHPDAVWDAFRYWLLARHGEPVADKRLLEMAVQRYLAARLVALDEIDRLDALKNRLARLFGDEALQAAIDRTVPHPQPPKARDRSEPPAPPPRDTLDWLRRANRAFAEGRRGPFTEFPWNPKREDD